MTALEREGSEGSIPESIFQGIRSVNREGTCPGRVWVLDGRGGDRDRIGIWSRVRRGVGNRGGVAVSRASAVGRIAQRAAPRGASSSAAGQGPVRAREVTVVVADVCGKDSLRPRGN